MIDLHSIDVVHRVRFEGLISELYDVVALLCVIRQKQADGEPDNMIYHDLC